MVEQARKLKKEKGILAIPDAKKDFYQSDENSRVIPRAKDKVSIKKIFTCKRLILSNLRELYSSFIWECPNLNIGFPKFCNIRPKQYVLAGSAGTHTVCVCSIHQNVKLLLDVVKIEESYKDLIKMLICNVENNECILCHCDNCPSDDALIEYLTAKLSEDYDLEEEIIISQMVNTHRTEIVKQSISIESFISLLSKSVENLIPHSYITKSQSKTFKKLKEDLPLNTAIVIMDFSENYSYTIQNKCKSNKTATAVYDFCKVNIEKINFHFIDKKMLKLSDWS
ncbi:hypothetical protein QYM36_009556 [Artemia franciscana]|uniref:Uncharacterized protein n=1 Tax=Artemia franciscana TaxID=6661 RepID=A0AA88LA19_ARTSF|nr:hypothetical protein QYM36_009556 [Artemia franciscana]